MFLSKYHSDIFFPHTLSMFLSYAFIKLGSTSMAFRPLFNFVYSLKISFLKLKVLVYFLLDFRLRK